jgi:hypothetical protein
MTPEDQMAGWRVERYADGSYGALLGGNLAVGRDGRPLTFPTEHAAAEFVEQQLQLNRRARA